jgi:uncharacterized membrane protein
VLFLLLKSLHIASVVLFLGNVSTGAFWKFHADKLGELRARAQALDGIIESDRRFTVPGVFLIVATGVAMAMLMGYPLFGTPWILWSLVLFGIAGATFSVCVGPLQKRLLANVRAGMAGNWNEAEYKALSHSWLKWGAVATGAPVGALFLMVFKPG